MATIKLQQVTDKEQICQVAQLADEIWHEHYQNILSPEQIDYMVERYQSVQAITEQLEQGYHYLLALEDGQPCGFCGYHRETDRMFLSKIYIRKDFRRRGIASAFLKQVTEESQGLAAIYLTVNKHNAGSIAAYQHFGFETIDSVVTDIGHGYVMDDFIMQKSL
ncbi:GNAT family N-acetyltransferase [Negativibacillus massiliensis]|uniref:GNAT family N-acetyltransferase n=1 Tax=Negativibacillus massiliensis TaxID=1871035 RepID=UPI0030B868A5